MSTYRSDFYNNFMHIWGKVNMKIFIFIIYNWKWWYDDDNDATSNNNTYHLLNYRCAPHPDFNT